MLSEHDLQDQKMDRMIVEILDMYYQIRVYNSPQYSYGFKILL